MKKSANIPQELKRTMIEGDENRAFNAENQVTLSEFLKMLLLSAKIDCSYTSEYTYWGIPYLAKAKELNLITSDISTETVAKEIGSQIITRGATAYYMNELFLGAAKESVNTPTLLYQYYDNFSNYRSKAFGSYTDISEDYIYRDAVYQMYMNNIMNGRSSTAMEPESNLTRAEVCTMIIRCLFNLDENIPQIMVNIVEGDEADIVNLELTSAGIELDNIVFDNNNRRTYTITIAEGDTNRYYVGTYGTIEIGQTVNIKIIPGDAPGQTVGSYGAIDGHPAYYIEGAGTYNIRLVVQQLKVYPIYLQLDYKLKQSMQHMRYISTNREWTKTEIHTITYILMLLSI